jgi:hypothetical protein
MSNAGYENKLLSLSPSAIVSWGAEYKQVISNLLIFLNRF